MYDGTYGGIPVIIKRSSNIKIIEREKQFLFVEDFEPHENVIKFYGTTSIDGYPAIILEKCDGNLTSFVVSDGTETELFKILSLKSLVKQATVGLQFLHSKGYGIYLVFLIY